MINLDKQSQQAKEASRKAIRTLAGVLGLLAIITILICSAFFGPDKKPAPPPAVVIAPVPPAIKKGELADSDVFAAVFRALRADKVCVDHSRNKLMIRFPVYEDLKKGDNDYWVGWWITDMPEFHYLPGNNTWYLYEIPNKELVHIWPTSKGLVTCGLVKDYEDK